MGPPFAPQVVMGALMLPRFLSAFGLCREWVDFGGVSIKNRDNEPKLNWNKSFSRYGTHSSEIFPE